MTLTVGTVIAVVEKHSKVLSEFIIRDAHFAEAIRARCLVCSLAQSFGFSTEDIAEALSGRSVMNINAMVVQAAELCERFKVVEELYRKCNKHLTEIRHAAAAPLADPSATCDPASVAHRILNKAPGDSIDDEELETLSGSYLVILRERSILEGVLGKPISVPPSQQNEFEDLLKAVNAVISSEMGDTITGSKRRTFVRNLAALKAVAQPLLNEGLKA